MQMYMEVIAFIVLFACMSSRGSGTEAVGSRVRCAVIQESACPGITPGPGVRRTDGRTDGWMEISCYGERRTATGIEPRAVAHRRPAAATSVSIRPSPATSSLPAVPRSSLHPERRRSARQREIGKYEKARRS